MKDFRISDSGDVVLAEHDIQLVDGKDETLQKIKLVLSTNIGEWFLNLSEGIDFSVLLAKRRNDAEILATIEQGLKQIDESYVITDYSVSDVRRHRIINFKAESETDEITLAVGDIQDLFVGGKKIDVLVCALSAKEILNAGDALTSLIIDAYDRQVYYANGGIERG